MTRRRGGAPAWTPALFLAIAAAFLGLVAYVAFRIASRLW